MPYGGRSQVITTDRTPTSRVGPPNSPSGDVTSLGPDVRVIGQQGTVESLSWTSAIPGGDQGLSMTLRMADRTRTPALRPGRLVFVYRGGGVVWRGTMSEPQPDPAGGWAITCQGEGTYGNQVRAFHALSDQQLPDGSPSADWVIIDAINRGLRWRWVQQLDTAITQAELTAQRFENASRTVTEAMNAWTAGGTKTWIIGRADAGVRIYTLPSINTPTRLLLTADQAGRTLAGYYSRIFLRYQFTQDSTGNPAQMRLAGAANDAAKNLYGPGEGYADYSNGGFMTEAAAEGRARGLLNRYEATSYTQEFTVTPGMVTTLGGSPVDLGTERAGEVYQVIGADTGYGSELTAWQGIRFLSGGYTWDDFAQAARIRPYQFVTSDFSSLVAAMAPPPAVRVS